MVSRFLIYALVDPRDGQRFYVGQSSIGLERPRQHMTPGRLSESTPKADHLRMLVALGLRPEVEVLERLLDPDEPIPPPMHCWTWNDVRALDAREMWWIAHGRSQGWPLTNRTIGGDGVRGAVVTTAHRANMSKAAIGKKKAPFSDEHRANMSNAMSGKRKSPDHIANSVAGRSGWKPTSSHIAKLVAANTGRVLDAETRTKISVAVRNSPRAIAQRAALAASQTGKKRRPWTEVQKAGLRLARPSTRGVPISAEHRASISTTKRNHSVGRRLALLLAGLAFL